MQHLIGIDFESFYDTEYSLSKMPTHQYIRDPRWQCLGAGFQIDGDEPFYAHDAEPVLRKLDELGWENITLVAHNAAFDGSVLWERFGKRRPRRWIDTQLIARWAVGNGHLPPDQNVSLAKLAPLVGMQKGDTWGAVHGDAAGRAAYGTDDIIIMMALLKLFMHRYKPSVEELDYMDMHVRMMTEPKLALNEEILEREATITPEDEALHKLLRKDANMIELLTKLGVEVAYKTTPKGKRKPALAKTDTFMQDLQNDERPMVAELASRRLGANSSLTRTRARTMLNVGDPLPWPVIYYGCHTGRASGSDGYNMQNNPAGGMLRRALEPPPGYVFVVGDSSQIEARGVGELAGDEKLLNVFREADAASNPLRDAYRLFGGEYLYHLTPEELTDFQRKIAKAGMLGLGYGQGFRGLIAQSRAKSGLIIPEEDGIRAQNAYREGFDRVPPWWKRLKREAVETGRIMLPDGRCIIYPDMGRELLEEDDDELTDVYYRALIHSKGPRGKRQRSKFWHGACANHATQAHCRSIVFWQARGMRNDGIPVVGMSHDEVVSIARIGNEAEETAQHMLKWLRTNPPFAPNIPLNGSVQIADNYAEAK